MFNLTSILLAFCSTLLCILSIWPLAKKVGLVDIPGGRKSHQGQVPLIGGIAMFFGFTVGLLTLPMSLQPYRSLLAACLLLVFTGILGSIWYCWKVMPCDCEYIITQIPFLCVVMTKLISLNALCNFP